jgi:hypothetical protein
MVYHLAIHSCVRSARTIITCVVPVVQPRRNVSFKFLLLDLLIGRRIKNHLATLMMICFELSAYKMILACLIDQLVPSHFVFLIGLMLPDDSESVRRRKKHTRKQPHQAKQLFSRVLLRN